jgi:hypothetical protein
MMCEMTERMLIKALMEPIKGGGELLLRVIPRGTVSCLAARELRRLEALKHLGTLSSHVEVTGVVKKEIFSFQRASKNNIGQI